MRRPPLPPPHHDQYQMDYGRPPYDFKGPPPPRGQGPPQYDSPMMPHDRQPRPMHRNTMGNAREDYSPSPGPHGYERGGRQPPMMGGQNHWGGGYDPNYDSPRMRVKSHGPPPQGPPISVGGHHPPPMPDRGFRPVPYRATTPSDAPSPLPTMSPAPSPRPTPPPTPPPPNPNLIGGGHPHGPVPPLPGPHPRPHHHGQGPPMGPGLMQPPGPPRMGPRLDGPRPDGMGPRPPGPLMHHRGPWEQGGPPPREFVPPPRGMMAGMFSLCVCVCVCVCVRACVRACVWEGVQAVRLFSVCVS